MDPYLYHCSFCYKHVDQDEVHKEEEKEQLISRFKMLIYQYFESTSTSTQIQIQQESEVKLKACQDCMAIITSFCGLYQQLKCLELEVGGRLSTLKNVMVLADEVELRKGDFRKRGRNIGGCGRDAIRHRLYRKELIKKCNSLPLMSHPNVAFTKTQRKTQDGGLPAVISDNPESAISFTGMMLDLVLVSDDHFMSSTTSHSRNIQVDLENRNQNCLPSSDDTVRDASPAPQPTSSASSPPPPPPYSSDDLNSSAAPVQMEVWREPCAPTSTPQPEIKCVTTTFVDNSIIAIKVDLGEEKESRMEVDVDIPPPDNLAELEDQNQLLPTPAEKLVLTENEHLFLPPSPSSPPASFQAPSPPPPTRTLRPRRQIANVAEKDSETDEDDNNDDGDDFSEEDYVPEEEDSEVEDEPAPEPVPPQKSEEPPELPPPPPLFLKSFEPWRPLEGDSRLENTVSKVRPSKIPTPNGTLEEEKDKIKCRRCGRKFSNKKERRAHEKLHGNFSCSNSNCDFTTKYAPKLAEHELIHFLDEEEIIADDDDSASAKKKLRKGSLSIRCPRCPPLSSKLPRKTTYIEHFLEVHLNLRLPNKCPICKASFSDNNLQRDRKNHMVEHHNIERMDPSSVIRCGECPAYFRRHMQHFLHNKKMHNSSLLKCKDCESKLIDMSGYRNHRIRVHKLEPSDFTFVCEFPTCEERAETEMELQFHYSSIHGNRKEGGGAWEQVICDECGKELLGISSLKSHMKTHSPEYQANLEASRNAKKFVCDECGKVFNRKCTLEQHKYVVHLGSEHWKFECGVCGKKCCNKSKLEEHQRVHGKEKPFICDVCGVSYAHQHNLRIHTNKAHGEGASSASEGGGGGAKNKRGGKKRKLEDQEED